MENQQGDGGRPGIRFRNSVIYFGPRLWWALGLAVAVVVLTIIAAGHLGNGLLLGAAAVAGALVGTLAAPSPKPIDNSQIASQSVITLLDVQSNLQRASQSIVLAAAEKNPGLQAVHLGSARETLNVQDELLARAVDNWNSAAPGVVDRVIETRNSGRRRFKQLIEEGNWHE